MNVCEFCQNIALIAEDYPWLKPLRWLLFHLHIQHCSHCKAFLKFSGLFHMYYTIDTECVEIPAALRTQCLSMKPEVEHSDHSAGYMLPRVAFGLVMLIVVFGPVRYYMSHNPAEVNTDENAPVQCEVMDSFQPESKKMMWSASESAVNGSSYQSKNSETLEVYSLSNSRMGSVSSEAVYYGVQNSIAEESPFDDSDDLTIISDDLNNMYELTSMINDDDIFAGLLEDLAAPKEG